MAIRIRTGGGGLSRREFLRRGSGLAMAIGAGSLAPWLPGCGSDASPQPSEASWRALARSLRGTLLRPGDAGYAMASLPDNERYAATRPAGIALCASAEDVRTSLLWARQNRIALITRSGGHSYGGYSTTSGLMISLVDMSGVVVDPAAGVVVVEGGANNGTVSDRMQPFNLAISQGRCPTVGLSGLTLGGGFGFSARTFGLACDCLVETTIVTADGDILVCNERENSDLFWACRGGGGGNFGINTSFRYRAHPVGDVAVYQLEWSGRQAAAAVIAFFQQLLTTAPDAFSLRLGVSVSADMARARPAVDAIGQYFGSAAELTEILAPLLTAVPPDSQEIAEMTYWDGKSFLAELEGPGYYDERSTYQTEPLPEAGIDLVLDLLETWPGGGGSGGVKFFSWGGEINRVAPHDTAFIHRDGIFLTAFAVSWTAGDSSRVVDANLAWIDRAWESFQPYGNGHSYQNFIDPALDDWQRAYYGDNFERLVQVKAAVDPRDVFRFAQGIPTKI